MYRPRTHRAVPQRWMRDNCHDVCLKRSYFWPEPSVTSHPSPAGRGKKPHALLILAANAYRYHIGVLGIQNGPVVLATAQREMLDMPDSVQLAVRIQSWLFETDRSSPHYGPWPHEFLRSDNSEAEELVAIDAAKIKRDLRNEVRDELRATD